MKTQESVLDTVMAFVSWGIFVVVIGAVIAAAYFGGLAEVLR